MKEVTAVLNLSVNVDCPHCGYYIDLLNSNDTNGYSVNDDNDVMKQACPTNGIHWCDSHKNFEVHDVTCSQCKKEFNVKELEW